MKNTKYILVFMLMYVCHPAGWAQQSFRKCYGFDCKENKWVFSIFTGYSVPLQSNALINEIEQQVSDNAGAGPENILRCFPNRHITQSRNQFSWNVEARYLLRKGKAISLSAGKLNGQSISAFAEGSDEPFFQFNNEIYNATLNYNFPSRLNRDEINIGPVIAWHHVNTNQEVNAVQGTSSLKAGVNVGYTFRLIHTKKWTLGLKANYTWLHNAEIGPIPIEHELNDFAENSDMCTSTIGRSKIHLQTLQFGLTTGWRF